MEKSPQLSYVIDAQTARKRMTEHNAELELDFLKRKSDIVRTIYEEIESAAKQGALCIYIEYYHFPMVKRRIALTKTDFNFFKKHCKEMFLQLGYTFDVLTNGYDDRESVRIGWEKESI